MNPLLYLKKLLITVLLGNWMLSNAVSKWSKWQNQPWRLPISGPLLPYSGGLHKVLQVAGTVCNLGNELVHTKIHAFPLYMARNYFNHWGTLVCQKVRFSKENIGSEIHFLCFEIKVCLLQWHLVPKNCLMVEFRDCDVVIWLFESCRHFPIEAVIING